VRPVQGFGESQGSRTVRCAWEPGNGRRRAWSAAARPPAARTGATGAPANKHGEPVGAQIREEPPHQARVVRFSEDLFFHFHRIAAGEKGPTALGLWSYLPIADG